MSWENVELVRSIYGKWARGDYSTTEWQHPDVEFTMVDGPNPGRGIGAGGIAEGWGDFLSAWKNFRQVADEYRDLDDERVLVLSTSAAGVGRAASRSSRWEARQPGCSTSATERSRGSPSTSIAAQPSKPLGLRE